MTVDILLVALLTVAVSSVGVVATISAVARLVRRWRQ